MSKYIPDNQKHLTLDDRKYIEKSLNQGFSFKEIAKYLCKDPTTISKEVRAHRLSDWYHKGTFYNAHNFCIHRCRCRKTNVCRKIILCDVKCASCPTCSQTCPDFVRERGPTGIRLIIGDRNPGMPETIPEVFPDARYQRCTVHFYRNIFSVIPRNKMKPVAMMLKAIHAQENKKAAREKAIQATEN